MLVSGSPSVATKRRHGQTAGEPPERYSSRVVQFLEKKCNSLADFCLCGYFLVDFARGVAKMLVSGLPSLAAKDGHGRGHGKSAAAVFIESGALFRKNRRQYRSLVA